MVTQELERAALAFANVLRGITGKPLVSALERGIQQDCGDCPVARTAGGAKMSPAFGMVGGWHVGTIAALIGPRGGILNEVPVPPMASVFMAAFDSGEFPELVAGVAASQVPA